MSRMTASGFALLAASSLLASSCGLKDDLFIPSEEPQVAPTDTQSPDDAAAGEEEVNGKSSESAL